MIESSKIDWPTYTSDVRESTLYIYSLKWYAVNQINVGFSIVICRFLENLLKKAEKMVFSSNK